MALFNRNFTKNSIKMKLRPKYIVLTLGILIGATFLLIYLTDKYILTLNFYENSGDPVSGIPGQESQVYDNLQKWIYFSSALYLLVKLGMIALILYTALFLADQHVAFNRVFNVVVLAEFVFFIPAIIKVLWFHYYYPNGSLLDWHRFYVLSAITVFGSAPADWFYALQTLNVFEIGYWFLLAYGISRITEMNFDRSLRIVVFSYVPALFLWIAVVTFCCLMLFPGTS
jgi:hypothetical protein